MRLRLPNSSLLCRSWPTLAYLLLAFGVPGAAIPSLYHYVTAYPLLVVMFVAVYEIVILIGSFALKVWQRLESQWVERIAVWFDACVISMLLDTGIARSIREMNEWFQRNCLCL